jgi:acetyl esterase/lipase
MWLRLVGLTVLALPAAAQSAPPVSDTQPQHFTVQADVQYCPGGGRPLRMDVFVPEHRIATPTPAVLWIHGGGWEHGDKRGNSGAPFLADGGFVTASLTYRLSGEAPFPAAIEDCKCAIRFLRANAARFGIDPAQIGAAGFSAGGHLAELLATADGHAGLGGDGSWQSVSSRVQAAASYCGVSDLTQPFPSDTLQAIARFLGGTRAQAPELYKRASPVTYLSGGDPPLLLVHGEHDETVPFVQSTRPSAIGHSACSATLFSPSGGSR